MSSKSTPDQYGMIAVTLHWLTVVLIIGLLILGFSASSAEDNTAKRLFLQLHVPMGTTVMLLTLLRMVWWLFADKKPLPVSMPTWQVRVSGAVHVLLYIVMLGLGISGVGMMVLSGALPLIFTGEATQLPNFWDYLPRTPHAIVARVLVALLIMHAGAALYHQFVMQDSLIRRMWYR